MSNNNDKCVLECMVMCALGKSGYIDKPENYSNVQKTKKKVKVDHKDNRNTIIHTLIQRFI